MAALATAATLVMPRMARPLVAVVAAVATVGACAAVIVLRWHYPTDALGGIGVGMGAVLVVDAVLHVPWAIASVFRPLPSDHRFEAQRPPRFA